MIVGFFNPACDRRRISDIKRYSLDLGAFEAAGGSDCHESVFVPSGQG